MRVVLGGGGSEQQEAPVLSRFGRMLRSNASLLYRPIAAADAVDRPMQCREWIERALHRALAIDMWPTLTGREPADIGCFDGLFIGGGNTFRLLHDLRNNGFDKAIAAFAEEGRPVYAGSAGAIILGSDISSAIHCDQNDVGLEDLRGLDLCAGAAIWCH